MRRPEETPPRPGHLPASERMADFLERAKNAKLRDDWTQRTEQAQRDIDHALAAVFHSDNPATARAIEYLEAITINRVLGPDASPETLRHLEGARWLYTVMKRAIERGRKGS